jgi:eukaryotic-like serine/threonine-protein kinase
MGPTYILGRYRYISRLGAGGSSTVVLAEDTLLGRRVALKRVHTPDDVSARSRLRREAVIGASLSHPNLVSIFDVVLNEDDVDVIVMEYIEGETLAAKLRRGEKPSVAKALEILAGVGAALDAIHTRGIVHRDVKPGNVLLGADGSVKLADLGIAAVADRTQITTTGRVLGTYRYMAPEQLEGTPATPAVDIYGLAAVAFEALSGQKARDEANPLALAQAIATQPPPDLRKAWPAAPAAAAEVLMQAMSRDPKARPRSAGELVTRLREALEPRQRPVVAPAVRVARPRPRRAAFVALAATLLAAVAVAAIVLANTRKPRQAISSAHVVSSVAAAHTARPAATRHAAVRPRQHRRARAHLHTSTVAAPVVSAPQASPLPPSPPQASTAQASPPPQAAPAPSPAPADATPVSTSPIAAVESFYHLAASHDYSAAWALMDPAFRAQLEGFDGLQATMAATRSITFNGADLVNESGNAATVSVRTTSFRDSGVQNCNGTVNLLRAGEAWPGWVLDHINISCV